METISKNVLKICHLADIHIKPTQRHDEYRRVFKNLTLDIQKRGVTHVWIGGDIFHTKLSGISPEYINLLHDTLRSLREVAEVHMMLGNHDGNLVNVERMDAVSPIVDIMNDPRVKLYKRTGVYPINDKANWCVYSPFDTDNWESLHAEKNKYNIACFHGAVHGATTASGWEMKGEKFVSDFDEFDIAMLGDIHKMQFLGNYNPPRIGYCGSTVQQSYDEDLDHGYLLWTIDLDSKKHEVEFVKIEGANPFITLVVNPDNYKSVISSDLVGLKNVRCRLICEDLTAVQKSSLKETLASNDAHEVVMLENQKSEKSVKKRISEAVKLDSIDSLISQAKHYAEHNVKTEVSWSNVEKEIRSYADKLKIGSTKPHRWTLKNFEFSNLYSYADNNEIDFASMSGLVGIIGPNASGKSSVLGALLYGLFNSSDRDCTKNAFYINDSKDASRTRCEIDVDGSVYEIIRTSTRHPINRDASATKLQLNALSKKSNLTGEQRNDTDKVIKDFIGSVDDFMMTSMAAQEDLGKFLKEGSTARKEIVSRFLGIDCLSDIHSLAKKEMNVVKIERKVVSTVPVSMLRDELKKKESSIETLASDLSSKSKDRDKLASTIQKIELEMSKVGSALLSRNALEKDIAKLCLLGDTLTGQITVSLNKKREHSERALELDSKIATIEAMQIVQKMKDAMKLKDVLGSAKNDLTVATEKLKTAEKSSLKLLEVPCGDSFPTCKFIVDSHKDKQSLASLKKTAQKVEAAVEDLVEQLAALKIDELLTKNKTRDDLNREKEALVRELHELDTSIVSKKESLLKVREKLETARVQFDSTDDKKVEMLVLARARHSEVQSSLDNAHSELGSLRKEIELIGKQIESCSVLDDRMDLLEAITEIFSKDGLPRFVMSQHLEHINNRMNVLLSKVVNFTVELRMDDEKGNLEVILVKNGKRRIAELGSGMERTLVSLALRVALRDISCIPMPDFFIIDEGFSMLDADNIMACKNLLNELKKMFRFVIVMTHNDAVKEMMDKTMEVSMVGEFSKLDGGKE